MSDKFYSRSGLVSLAMLAWMPGTVSAQLTYPTLPTLTAPPALPPAIQRLQTTFTRAVALQNKKKYREAINLYRDFLKQGATQKIPASSEAPAWGNIAYCYALLHDNVQQMTALQQYVKRVPTNAAAYAQLAGVYINLYQWKPAKQNAEKALSLTPPNDIKLTSLFALGTANLQLKDVAGSVDAYSKAGATRAEKCTTAFQLCGRTQQGEPDQRRD